MRSKQFEHLLDLQVSPRFLNFPVFILMSSLSSNLFIVAFASAGEVSILRGRDEALALLKWKSSLDRQSQSILASWAGNDPCRNWTQISCGDSMVSDRVVTRISLGSSSLSGHLQDLNFSLFPNLEVLSLNNNSLFGFIPYTIGNLSNLKVLDLSQNNFSGGIPSELGMLRSLELLYLQMNGLTGRIPRTLGNLTRLAQLYLSQNELTGSIPQEIGMLDPIKLENLDLSSNMLTGVIPSSLGNLTHMYFFYLYDNQLSGPIPPELVGAEALLDLQISTNNLTGTIPTSFKNFTRLERVYLFDNGLSGSIPQEINQTNIKVFAVHNNMFSGPLPRNFLLGGLLQSFTAGNNFFSGPIPSEIGKSRDLYQLSLSNNRLSGQVPYTIGNLTFLRFLSLDNNMLNGTLPVVPINMLAYSIKNNSLTGKIPSSVCNASFLKVIHLSDNGFHGVIPQCLGTFNRTLINTSDLTSINFNGNQLRGSVPKSLLNCKSLEVLDLGNNMISGTFPDWLDTLPELQVIVLKSNRLHGSIGASNSQLPFPKLRIIDLSGNLFTGRLPSKYFRTFKGMIGIDVRGQGAPTYMGISGIYEDTLELVVKGVQLRFERILTILTAIDLSNNKFEGEIPSFIGMLNSLRYLNLSRNQLTGPVPTTLGNITTLESLDLSTNQIKGKIPWQLIKLTFLSILNVSENQLSGKIPEGGQFNTYGNDSFHGNPALCGLPLTKKCGPDAVPPVPMPPNVEDSSWFLNGFTWQSIALGYGCGLVLGVGIGCLMFLSGKPKWVMRIVEGDDKRK